MKDNQVEDLKRAAEMKQAEDVYNSFFSVTRRLRKLAQQSAAELGLSVSQLTILDHVRSRPNQTQQEVTELLHFAKSRVSIHIDALVERGLVSRKTSAQDRRENKLNITAAGEEVCRRYKEDAASYRALAAALQPFSGEETALLLRLHEELASRLRS